MEHLSKQAKEGEISIEIAYMCIEAFVITLYYNRWHHLMRVQID